MDANLEVCFDGKECLCFVQGEDRQVQLFVGDGSRGRPWDLTGAVVTVHLPSSGGDPVLRSSQAATLVPASITVGSGSTVTFPSEHGLVDGDRVRFTGSSLPAPVDASTDYLVVRVDTTTISLTTTGGSPVVFTSAGSGTFTLGVVAVTLDAEPKTGCAMLNLSAACTNAVNPGQTQWVEVDILQAGKRRIWVGSMALTVVRPEDQIP